MQHNLCNSRLCESPPSTSYKQSQPSQRQQCLLICHASKRQRKHAYLCTQATATAEVPKKASRLPSLPFVKVAGQEEMKLALLLNVVDPRIGGVLIMGDRGTGKSVAVSSPSVPQSVRSWVVAPWLSSDVWLEMWVLRTLESDSLKAILHNPYTLHALHRRTCMPVNKERDKLANLKTGHGQVKRSLLQDRSHNTYCEMLHTAARMLNELDQCVGSCND